MEEVIDREVASPARRIYSINAIWVATFLGGPLSAGYFIAENFKTLGERNKVGRTWIAAIASTIIVFGGIFLVPDAEKIPRQLIPLVYSLIAYAAVKQLQGDKISRFIAQSGRVFSTWRTIGLSLLWCIATIAPIFLYLLVIEPTLATTSKSYGTLNHEIYFQEGNILETEVDHVAQALTEAGFFDEEQKKSVMVAKRTQTYVISVPLVRDAWNDPEVVRYFESLHNDIGPIIQEGPVTINLCTEEDILDVKKVVE
ncbi:MAG TPA: hypothetical protein VFI14_12600 [Chryseosolibacter sp.]|nr:hypothetical protein [Chryseosolibacter sp.]